MKKALLVVLLFIGTLAMTGCVGLNSMNYNAVTKTEVVLSQNNFTVVGQVQGECTQTYIMGFGGFTKAAVTENAIAEMTKNANLKGSQTIVNVSCTSSMRTFFGVFNQLTVVAHGTVIEFK